MTLNDIICLMIGMIGIILVIVLFEINDWDFEKVMFKEER